jgi:hypothetical protein
MHSRVIIGTSGKLGKLETRRFRQLADGPSGDVATEEPVETPQADNVGSPVVVESAGIRVGSKTGSSQLAKNVL